MKGAQKDGLNPHFKSHYASLDSCWEAARDSLGANELSVTQFIQDVDGKMYLHTILGHSSGQYIESRMALVPEKPGAQGLGSLISYMRRYSFAALLGLTQRDDDAEEATAPAKEAEVGKFLTDTQLAHIQKLAENNQEVANNILKYYKVKDFSQLKLDSAGHSAILQALERNK
jgi:hypothetical protein